MAVTLAVGEAPASALVDSVGTQVKSGCFPRAPAVSKTQPLGCLEEVFTSLCFLECVESLEEEDVGRLYPMDNTTPVCQLTCRGKGRDISPGESGSQQTVPLGARFSPSTLAAKEENTPAVAVGPLRGHLFPFGPYQLVQAWQELSDKGWWWL